MKRMMPKRRRVQRGLSYPWKMQRLKLREAGSVTGLLVASAHWRPV
jgi:hypothetical protein